MITHHSEMARRLGEDLGLTPDTLAALDASYEQWDGNGWPGELRGDDVPIAARLALIGEFVEVAHRVGGVEAARALLRAGRGKEFDPDLADAFEADADLLLAELDTVDAWDAVIGSEPALAVRAHRRRASTRPCSRSRTSSTSSRRTPSGTPARWPTWRPRPAARLGLPDGEVRTLRRAGLVHCFGKLGVSNAILDKQGPLTAGERERLHMVPYLTHRMLRQSPALRPVGDLAAQYGERLDGTGYPHGLAGPSHLAARRACSPPPTSTSHCASPGRSATRSPRPRRQPT